MKNILILSMLILISCGGKSDDTQPPHKEISDGERIDSRIHLIASRDYNPDTANSYKEHVGYNAFFRVPIEISVSEGQSGNGWLSLTLGDRKYCYQGNKVLGKNGDKFSLISEIEDINVVCSKNGLKDIFDAFVFLEKDDIIKLEVNGGGCGSNCGYVRVEYELTPME